MTPDPDVPEAAELLDALPYGVLAVSADGVILRANAGARKLVPGVATPAIPTCRDLFSCRAAGGPCERGCFVERAAGAAKVSAEIRIDTAGGISPGALWVTGVPLPAGHGAMLHLRPGWRGDRRRRSERRWQTEPALKIRALGRTQVEALDDSLDTEWLSQRPGQVLKYLVCERTRVVLVDEIAEAIWPRAEGAAVASARYAIHRLRLKLEPRRSAHEAPAFVISRGSGYVLDRDRVWIDVDDFERAISEGQAAMTRLDAAFATRHLERAMSLYAGPLLADEPYAHWADDERNRLSYMASSALRVLTTLARERNDNADALRHLQRAVELDPLDNALHRELIQTLLADGRRSEAKRRYENFARRLQRDLGERPDFDLRSLTRSKDVAPAW